jgi:hypothetical protein
MLHIGKKKTIIRMMEARTIKIRGRLFILFIILKRIPAPFQ